MIIIIMLYCSLFGVVVDVERFYDVVTVSHELQLKTLLAGDTV